MGNKSSRAESFKPTAISTISSKSFHIAVTSVSTVHQASQLSPILTTSSIVSGRRSSGLIPKNGVNARYVSDSICMIAASFWQQNIETLSISEQLEIGLSIFFGMIDTNQKVNKLAHKKQTVEQKSLHYLDIMGWLVRNTATDNIALRSLLHRLSELHQRLGVNIDDFNPMLQSMHETFAFYFESKYSIEVQYAIDKIFTTAAQMMTVKPVKHESFQSDSIPFLKNLHHCLISDVGKRYLYRYLEQTYCHEISMFLQYLCNFKCKTSDKERFMIASDITKKFIKKKAIFAQNISHETRTNIMKRMSVLEDKFALKIAFEINTEFFSEAEREVYRLIKQNHWKKFVEEIQALHHKTQL